MIKLPRFIRYLKCRSRLIRLSIFEEISQRETILNSYFSMAFIKYPQLFNTLHGEYIRFAVPVTYYKNSQQFREFEEIATRLCNRLGYSLLTGWGSCTDDKDDDTLGYYYYSVYPKSEIEDIKMALDGWWFLKYDKVVLFYDKMLKLRNL